MASRKQSDSLGIPPGLNVYSAFPFAGINLATGRTGLRDQEFFNLVNFVKVGDGNLRTLWDIGPALYTAPGGKTIINAFFYNIATTQYVAVFFNDGTGTQVNVATGAAITISGVNGNFYNGNNLPGCVQWGSQYLLMGNNHQQNAYWVWDGTLLYGAGSLSPEITVTDSGGGYTGVPTVTVYGGSGSGAVVKAIVQNGGVTKVYVVNPGSGYQPTDQVQLLFSGGGSDNGAELQAILGSQSLAGITLSGGGSGYTGNPTVIITPPPAGGTQATAAATESGGIVTSIVLGNPGSGYTGTPGITITGGQGAAATATLSSGTGAAATATLTGGVVSAINLTSGGTGYSSIPLVILGAPPTGGTQATATATISGGAVTGFTIVDAGSGYTAAPAVTIEGGDVSAITVTEGGQFYTSAPIVVIAAPETGGTQATATATVGGGSVTGFTITNAGSGYLSAPVVTLDSGSGATAFASIVAGGITKINVINGGSGFTSPPTLTIVGGGGTGATAQAILVGSSVTSITGGGGSGYTGFPVVNIAAPPPGGIQATADSEITDGEVTSYIITNAGAGYTSAPGITLTGGGGSGASAVATIGGGPIASVVVTNGGMGYTSVPAVEVESGINRAASATVQLMPYGVSGTALETFQSRVWIANAWTNPSLPVSQNNGNIFQVSAPESLSDFATSDGGVLFTSTDRFLRQFYTAMRQTNGYLYPIGDSSVAIISGVTTSGNPSTTTFNYQNTDPQVGTPWRDSCQDFGRTVLFANALGVYGLYGGSVTKVSKALDPLFTNAIFPPTAGALTPSSAVANIYGGKYYLLNMSFQDPITLEQENRMIVWDEQGWSFASQTVSFKFICTQEVNSDLSAWGSDGNQIFQLFQIPSDNLVKSMSTKLYGSQTPYLAKQIYTVILQGQNQQTSGVVIEPLAFTISVDTEAGTYPLGTEPVSFGLSSGYAQGYPVLSNGLTDVAGIFLGLTLSTNNPDVSLNYLGMSYIPATFQLSSIGAELES